jgi:Protein of unknown function (DUF4231)
MTWPRQRAPRDVLPSEKGFLELAGRAADLPLRDVFIHFRDLVSADMDWTDSRKIRFRTRASRVKVAALILTALSTIVLGIPAIPVRASIALPMVALVTVLSALETFFNWRSRWVLMEEAQYRLNRLRDEIDYYLVVTPSAEIAKEKLDEFFKEQQAIWSDVSRRWIEFRKIDHPPQGEQLPDLRSAI